MPVEVTLATSKLSAASSIAVLFSSLEILVDAFFANTKQLAHVVIEFYFSKEDMSITVDAVVLYSNVCATRGKDSHRKAEFI